MVVHAHSAALSCTVFIASACSPRLQLVMPLNMPPSQPCAREEKVPCAGTRQGPFMLQGEQDCEPKKCPTRTVSYRSFRHRTGQSWVLSDGFHRGPQWGPKRLFAQTCPVEAANKYRACCFTKQYVRSILKQDRALQASTYATAAHGKRKLSLSRACWGIDRHCMCV
jgi:hypothetical protein